MARQAVPLKKQTFRITEPKAQKVLLAGDFTDWQNRAIPMQKEPGGTWSVTVNLAPGKHAYLFMVDGQWCDDPGCAFRVPNPYGGKNMVREVA